MQCIRHAKDAWPNECVGAILLNPEGVLVYRRMENVHSEPHGNFLVDATEMEEALLQGELHGVHHSHPKANDTTGEGFCPSYNDMVSQLSWSVPFYITVMRGPRNFAEFFGWGDQLPVANLKKRAFKSGVFDCYSLVRHAHLVWGGEVYPDGPRGLNWWNDADADNPFLQRLNTPAFQRVEPKDLRPGDDLLFSLSRGVISHCGVYLGHDLFLHHLHGRLSRVDPLPQWSRKLAMAVRYAPGAETEEKQR